MPHLAPQNHRILRLALTTPVPFHPLRSTELHSKAAGKRIIAIRAWLQGDAAALIQTASAAVLSSALTSAWIASKTGSYAGENRRNGARQGSDSQQDAALPSTAAEPASTDDIWQQAWAAFTTSPIETRTPSEEVDAAQQEEDALPQHPLLWLQGIRHTERVKLLAVSLAAIEQQIATLNPSDLISTQPDSLNARCAEVLAGATLAASQAWLRYIPRQLETQLSKSYLSTDRHSASDDVIEAAESTTPEADRQSMEEQQHSLWYMLSQRLGLYCSVLCLLKCSTIQSQGDSEGLSVDDGGESTRTTTGQGSHVELDAAAASVSPRQLGAQLLQHQSLNTSINIRGWTAAGGGSTPTASSLLLAIAPSVIQDMAILVADAVAAAYLADVASGLVASTLIAPTGPDRYHAVDQHDRQRAVGLRLQDTTAVESNPTALQLPSQQQGLGGTYTNSLDPAGSPAQSLEFSFWPTFTHPRLSSTRQLQRFANLITVHRWADRNFKSAAAIVEDRLPLFTLAAGVKIRMLQAPMRRGAELQALRGIQLAASLVLEAMDLVTPIFSVLWKRASAAVSWMLTHVVGKTLGLIYQGVKSGAEASARSAAAGAGVRFGNSGKPNKKKARYQRNDTESVTGKPSDVKDMSINPGWGGQSPKFGT